MAIYRVLDEDGKVLKEKTKSFSHYRRYSMKCAAEQRFLDKLWVKGAIEGRIIEEGSPDLCFRFDANGMSQHYFPT